MILRTSIYLRVGFKTKQSSKETKPSRARLLQVPETDKPRVPGGSESHRCTCSYDTEESVWRHVDLPSSTVPRHDKHLSPLTVRFTDRAMSWSKHWNPVVYYWTVTYRIRGQGKASRSDHLFDVHLRTRNVVTFRVLFRFHCKITPVVYLTHTSIYTRVRTYIHVCTYPQQTSVS